MFSVHPRLEMVSGDKVQRMQKEGTFGMFSRYFGTKLWQCSALGNVAQRLSVQSGLVSIIGHATS